VDESALRLERIFTAAASRPVAAAAPLRALAWAGLAWLAPHEGGAAVITPAAAAASFSGRETSASLLCALLDDLRPPIAQARPHAICSHCKGKGCKKCQSCGWWTRAVVEGMTK
jgi:hypothetical protein